ncbi:hypothetical protein D3C84_834380 [compost metagenome]
MHQHKNQAVLPQAEPQQCQWQQRDRRQRVEHRGQCAQQVATKLGRHRQCGQGKRQNDADQVTLEQHHQRNPDLAQQFATEHAVIKRAGGLHKTGQQQVVVLNTGDHFPQHHEQNQDQAFTNPALLPKALAERQFTLQRYADQWL